MWARQKNKPQHCQTAIVKWKINLNHESNVYLENMTKKELRIDNTTTLNYYEFTITQIGWQIKLAQQTSQLIEQSRQRERAQHELEEKHVVW